MSPAISFDLSTTTTLVSYYRCLPLAGLRSINIDLSVPRRISRNRSDRLRMDSPTRTDIPRISPPFPFYSRDSVQRVWHGSPSVTSKSTVEFGHCSDNIICSNGSRGYFFSSLSPCNKVSFQYPRPYLIPHSLGSNRF